MPGNCSVYPALKANPDISGIGVIAAFSMSVCLTFLCCIAHSTLSRGVVTFKKERWVSGLRGAIIGFSDQQLATGFSVIIAGYSQLGNGISVYHWIMMCNLAWFSSMTHLITLTCLKSEIRSQHASRWIRIFLMGILNVLLIVSIVPTGYLYGGPFVPNNLPARCLFQKVTGWRNGNKYSNGAIKPHFNAPYILISTLILGFGYLSRSWALIRGETNLIHGLLRVPRDQPWSYFEHSIAQNLTQLLLPGVSCTIKRYVVHTKLSVLRSLYASIIACCEITNSITWEFTWLAFAVTWGLIRIFRFHAFGIRVWYLSYNNAIAETAEEYTWGFGQVVPIVLLGLPVAGFFGGYANTKLIKSIVKEEDTTNSIEEDATRMEPFSISQGFEDVVGIEEVQRRLTNIDPESSQMPDPPSMAEQCRPWKESFQAELAYKYIRGLIYTLACALGVDLLLTYPAQLVSSIERLARPEGLRATLQSYFLWIAADFVILLLASFCFVLNMSSSRYKLRARFAHLVYFSMDVIFVGMCVGIYIAVLFGYIP